MKRMMRNLTLLLKKNSGKIALMMGFAGVFFLASCAHNETIKLCLTGHQYGFWGGLWHGFIAPFDLIGMLFFDDLTVYATNTNGAWYALGFLIGSGGWGFLGGKSLGRK